MLTVLHVPKQHDMLHVVRKQGRGNRRYHQGLSTTKKRCVHCIQNSFTKLQ